MQQSHGPPSHEMMMNRGPVGIPLDQRHLNGMPDLPKLQNIVSTAYLNKTLNLREIALKAKNVEYKPKRFAAAIMRIRDPKTTALIFASGKMVCTGAKSEEESENATK